MSNEVDAGSMPLDSSVSDTDFGAAFSYFVENYALPSDRQSLASSDAARNPDSNFYLKSQEMDTEFSFLRPELLLNQIADILDRAINTRQSFDEFSSKAVLLAIELQEFFAADEVHKEEVTSGIYTLEYRSAYAESLSVARQIQLLGIAIYYLNTAEETVSGFLLDKIDAAVIPAAFQYQNFDSDFSYDGKNRKTKDWMKWAAMLPVQVDTQDRKFSLLSQIADLESRKAALEAQMPALEHRADWHLRDIEFKRRRTEVARDAARMKVLLSCLEDGALNYAERRDRARGHFTRDISDALGRFKASAKGLHLLYGYESNGLMEEWIAVGIATRAELDATPFLGKIDPFLGWIRDAIAWLARFHSNDVQYTRVFSLRQMVGEVAWKKGLATGLWEFSVADDHFPDQRHIRLKNLSVFAVWDRTELWSAVVELPKISSIRHMDGSNIRIDQQFLPSIRFGRICRRSDVRSPEVSNAATVQNASPLGAWSVQIAGTAANQFPISDLQDLHLDIDVFVREAR
jgi:hypothetical protein